MKWLFPLFFLSACYMQKSSNEIDELSEAVIKRKEGVDIRVTPIEESKKKAK